MELLDNLQWRYATKRMNGRKIPREKLNNILEAIRLAPSSLGLQPYSVFVVESDEVKKKISEKACIQPQVLEGSHLIVFAAWKKVTSENVDAYMENVSKTRGVELASLNQFKNMVQGFVARSESEGVDKWTARQAYIPLGVGLVAAAEEKVDATPMEGFDSDELDKVLGLEEKGLTSVAMLALGYRDDENDALAKAAKVRRSNDELFTFV